MADLTPTLIRLRSPDKENRLKACNELRSAKKLTEGAILALQDANYDLEPAVRRAAARTLFVHRVNKVLKPLGGVLVVLVIVAVAAWLFLPMTKASRLACARVRPGANVNCTE